jgi:hypothetical protein
VGEPAAEQDWPRGTFADPKALARDLASLMRSNTSAHPDVPSEHGGMRPRNGDAALAAEVADPTRIPWRTKPEDFDSREQRLVPKR